MYALQQPMETALDRSKLEAALQPERHYVIDLAEGMEIPLTIARHPYDTTTCHEKADLLQKTHPDEDWHPSRVIKAVYGLIDDEIPVGFIFPELGQRKGRKSKQKRFEIDTLVAAYALKQAGVDQKISDIYIGRDALPRDMSYGTCTPFISPAEMASISDSCEEAVQGLFILRRPELEDKLVDISIGGEDRTISMHLPYRGIIDILQAQYPGKVYEVSFGWER